MTTAAARYLEESKIDELVRQLKQQGYEVERPPHNKKFDLVAVKGERRIAFEVKARPADHATVKGIARRRTAAFASGFDEFRLVVVNPPHETRIDVPGLNNQLLRFLGEHRIAELDGLPGATRAEGVTYVDIDKVELTPDGARLVGSGIVSVEIQQDSGEEERRQTWEMDFPFTFDVMLGHDLRIEDERSSMRVDTSDFYE